MFLGNIKSFAMARRSTSSSVVAVHNACGEHSTMVVMSLRQQDARI